MADMTVKCILLTSVPVGWRDKLVRGMKTVSDMTAAA